MLASTTGCTKVSTSMPVPELVSCSISTVQVASIQ